jgi:hypothetical protein
MLLELTVIAAVVGPLLHAYVPPPEAVNVTVPGLQKVVAPDGVIVAVGLELTDTVPLAVAVHPAALVTVTLYTVLPAGLTVIGLIV